jgi:hypothetical protein
MGRAASSLWSTTALGALILVVSGGTRVPPLRLLGGPDGLRLDTHLHAQEAALPPLSYTCPHHPDVIEPRAGTCPLCSLPLEPVRLDSSWMCPIHSAVQQTTEGSCRICKRALVRVTVSLTWSCRGEADHLEPGRCQDGSPRMAARTLRPHGNHNPQRGGQFFMAPDNWHHLEGTYPREGIFRLFVYDDYARALGADPGTRRHPRDVRPGHTADARARVGATAALERWQPSRSARGRVEDARRNDRETAVRDGSTGIPVRLHVLVADARGTG